MVEHAVVVARQLAVAVDAHTAYAGKLATLIELSDEDMPPSVERRRHEGDAPSVGRPPRLEIHRAVRNQQSCSPRPDLEHLERDSAAVVGDVGDEATIG